ANATNNPVTQLYGTGVYWTLDGSATWTGFNQPPFGSNSGDPVSVIGTDGRFYENYITNSLGQGVAVSTNSGVNWTTHVVAPNPGSLADKNHYMVDKKIGSPYENRSYCSWLDFGGPYDGEVVLRYSTNFGQTWTASINISGTLTPLGSAFAQGTNVQTGPNGEVYVVYAIYDANWTDGEDAMGFSKSTDGGVTWTHQRIYQSVNFGIRGNLSSKNGIRVSSFPSMAVDRTGGSTNGNIYVCWPQRGTAPAGSDPDIVLIKSTDGGTTWTSPIRVNDDAMNNGKDQYYCWSTVDQATGQLMLIFYDSRDVPNNQADVYMARSFDGGNTFENFKVSDQPHTPSPIPGLAGGYAGDYIGVAALDDLAYPFWADNRTGNYQAWTAVVSFGPPCPVDPPSNPNPVNGATAVSINIPEISWTNGVGATQVEVWFGEAGSMTQVYNGTPITSWSIPGPLSYNTMYNWRIVGKNDTCNVSGPIWAFTTELSPGIIFIEPFENLSCWTPIGPLGTTN
ncbi:MAG: sialidase family protein, partial [Ignavibacteriaceae bacterium]